jgi:hypothetical protein
MIKGRMELNYCPDAVAIDSIADSNVKDLAGVRIKRFD